MRIQLQKAVSAYYLFETFLAQSTEKLPIQTAFQLAKLHSSLTTEFNFYRTTLQSYIKKYADYDENGEMRYSADGENIILKKETLDECTKKMTELENLNVELPDNITFSLDDLSELKVSLSEMEALLPFIKE